jgi:hypothetical protein
MLRSVSPLSFFLLSLLCVLVVNPSSAYAAKVKVWEQRTPAQYDKAQLQGAVVTSEGTLRLSRRLKPLPGIDAAHVWDVTEDGAGNLYVATGDEGKLYRVTADGKVSVVYSSDDSEVLCLARSTDGSIYAGTGPAGHIIRVDPQGAARVIADIPESYVWSLAVDAAGTTIYAGTGPHGRIYRLAPDGKPTVFYTTRQEHIHCLALAADGTLYAGTDRAGLVYRIDPRGKGFVLFSAAQSEVRSLVVADGVVYAGTCAPTKHRPGGGSSPASSGTSAAAAPFTPAVRVSAARGAATGAGGSALVADKEPARGGSPAAPPSAAGAGENSLYRITADGSVREVFRDKAMVLCLLRQPGHFFVGTGMNGQLFEVDETTRENSEVARLDHGQVLCLSRRADGPIVLGTGDPGKLYVLEDRYAARGSVVSEILDAKLVSRWGALHWQADTPAGTAVTVAVRSGNVAEPDDTWSDWSAEQADARQAVADAPPARFCQYRVTLTSDNPASTPAIKGVTLRFRTTNQAPEMGKVEVPDLDATNRDDPKRLKFHWSATDANEDELTYSVYVRKEGWKHWVQLEDDLEKTEYDWDTTTTPSGVYQLKVVASDRRDNAAEEALTGERVSAPFVVSHTPPTVTVKVAGMEGGQAVLEASATDPLARLTAASFSVNGKKWVNVFPTDGIFDSKSETFKFKTDGLKPGTYVVVLRVRDAAGNTGSADVVFTVQARPAAE